MGKIAGDGVAVKLSACAASQEKRQKRQAHQKLRHYRGVCEPGASPALAGECGCPFCRFLFSDIVCYRSFRNMPNSDYAGIGISRRAFLRILPMAFLGKLGSIKTFFGTL